MQNVSRVTKLCTEAVAARVVAVVDVDHLVINPLLL